MDNIVSNFYKRIKKTKTEYNEEFISKKLEEYSREFSRDDIKMVHDFSTYLEGFLLHLDPKDIENVQLIKNMSTMYINDEYINSLIEKCYISSINFKKYLSDNNMDETFMIKDFIISFYIIILFMPLTKLVNFELFETIQILWLIVDNTVDNESMNKKYKHILKPLFVFLKGEIYKEPNVGEFMKKHKDNMCIKLVQQIYDNPKLKDHTSFFDDARKLFMYSYSEKGIGNEHSPDSDILKTTINKAFISLNLFKHCFEEFEIDNKIMNLCFIGQLSDDLQDLEEDIVNKGNTIFTSETRTNRCVVIICLLDLISEIYGGTIFKYYLGIPVLDSIIYNKHLLDQRFVKQVLDYKIINEKCNLRKLEDLFFNKMIDKVLDLELVKLYNVDIVKMEREQIIEKMRNMSL